MRVVCCVCTGRHHPLACPTAVARLDQCADPTPDDFTAPPEPLAVVFDLYSRRRSPIDPVASSGRRAERHRSAALRRWRA